MAEESRGKEFLQRIGSVVDELEQAIVRREKKLVGSKIPQQAEVDAAKKKLIETVVQVVKEAKEAY
ncbi:MAG: hypothetical protein ACE5PT_00655 [Gemmatimonadales bacterium]